MPAGYPKDNNKRQVWNGSGMTSLSVERREISFLQGVDFLTEHGIHELKAIRLLTGAAQ